MKKLLTLLLLATTISTQAKIKVIVHYNFGHSGNVTYAAAPNEISDAISKVKLIAKGHPVFYADAPSDKAQSVAIAKKPTITG